VTDIVDALEIVSKLRGRRYQWRDQPSSSTGPATVIGFIAQEVQKVLPEVVHQDTTTGLYSVSYIEILPILTDAFNEFVSQYKEKEIERTEQIRVMQEKIDQLMKLLEKNSMMIRIMLTYLFVATDEVAFKRAVITQAVVRFMNPKFVFRPSESEAFETTPLLGYPTTSKVSTLEILLEILLHYCSIIDHLLQ
jgi:hypothetical protein